eukprot:12960075-Heterocapsa_arctica.AAC.1
MNGVGNKECSFIESEKMAIVLHRQLWSMIWMSVDWHTSLKKLRIGKSGVELSRLLSSLAFASLALKSWHM